MMVRDGKVVSLFIDGDAYELSMHNRTACAQCHTEVDPRHPERACATITMRVDCGICHAEQVHDHELSRHGQLAVRGDADSGLPHLPQRSRHPRPPLPDLADLRAQRARPVRSLPSHGRCGGKAY